MKNFKQIIFVSLIMGLAGVLLTACSDDEPKYLKHDIKAATVMFTRMSNGEVEAAYKSYDFHRYEKHENTGNKWVEITETLYGCPPNMDFTWNHDNCFVKDGYVWFEFCGFNTNLGFAWSIFCEVTGTYRDMLIPYPITFTQEGTHVIFGNEECELIYADNNMFTLAHERTYSSANKDGIPTPGLMREVKTYKLDPDRLQSAYKYHWYSSERELITGVAAQIRAEFGNEFDINYYLPTNRRWSSGSVLNIDQLEKQELEALDRKEQTNQQ